MRTVPSALRYAGNPDIVRYCPSCEATAIPFTDGPKKPLCPFCGDFVVPVGADQMMLRLRRAGLSYESIAAVGREAFGWEMTKHQVRGRLKQLGAVTNPAKNRVAA